MQADGAPTAGRVEYWLEYMQGHFGGSTAVEAFGIDSKGQREVIFMVSSLFTPDRLDSTAYSDGRVVDVCDTFTQWCEKQNQTSVLYELTEVKGVLRY